MTVLAALRKRYPYRDREQLLARVLCGEVVIGGQRTSDPKAPAPRNWGTCRVTFLRRRYVSRGGEKLEAALHAFRIIPAGGIFLDAGSSTGGFTDCLLKHGAARVYAVDVGRNELAPTLREDPRVVAMEGTNIMSLEELFPAPGAAVCDISFRRIRKVVAKLLELTEGGEAITLVKPQFELAGIRGPGENLSGAGETTLPRNGSPTGETTPASEESYPGESDFQGVIRSRRLLQDLLRTVVEELAADGIVAVDWLLSPVSGRRGNREAFFRFLPRELMNSRGSRELRPEDIVIAEHAI